MREEPQPEGRELTPFEKMRELAAKVITAPKSEVDRRQEEWKESRKPDNLLNLSKQK
jgi:hypothetical protein